MIIGMDSFVSLATWREWEALFDLAHFAVAERPGYALNVDELPTRLAQIYRSRHAEPITLMKQAHGCIVHFPSTLLDISASDIRARIARGNSARYLIPETVLRYIESKGLYR
jgi:nicotinate-nucleotide adenylyltransferase